MFRHHGTVSMHSITLNCYMFRHHCAVSMHSITLNCYMFRHNGAVSMHNITLNCHMFRHNGAVSMHSIILNCYMFRHDGAVLTHSGAIFTQSINLNHHHMFRHNCALHKQTPLQCTYSVINNKNAKIILYTWCLFTFGWFLSVTQPMHNVDVLCSVTPGVVNWSKISLCILLQISINVSSYIVTENTATVCSRTVCLVARIRKKLHN